MSVHTTNPFNAAEETLLHVLDVLKDSPKCQTAVTIVSAQLSRFRLESEAHANLSAEDLLRPYLAKRAYGENINHGRIHKFGSRVSGFFARYGTPWEWVKDIVAFAFAVAFIVAAALLTLVFAAKFIPIGY